MSRLKSNRAPNCIQFYSFSVSSGLGAKLNGAQRSFLMGLKGSQKTRCSAGGVKLRLSTCKTNALSPVLSLQPQFNSKLSMNKFQIHHSDTSLNLITVSLKCVLTVTLCVCVCPGVWDTHKQSSYYEKTTFSNIHNSKI